MGKQDIVRIHAMQDDKGQPTDKAIEEMALLCGWTVDYMQWVNNRIGQTVRPNSIDAIRAHLLDPTSVVARERAVMTVEHYDLNVYRTCNGIKEHVYVSRGMESECRTATFIGPNEWWNRLCAVKWMEADSE